MPSVGHTSILKFSLVLVFLGSIAYIGYIPRQADFWHIFIPYSIAFLIYFIWVTHSDKFHFRTLLIVAIVARVLLIFAFPNLSDDIYRFLWDGNLINMGINPYAQIPTEIIQITEYQSSKMSYLWSNMNSQNYYTIYPLICQVIFAFSALFDEVQTSTIVLKILFVIFELGTFYFLLQTLNHGNKNLNKLFIYALNPLIIIELIGNLHFEAVMIFFFSCFFYLYTSGKKSWWIALALSIGAKLVPLMFLPYILLQRGIKKSLFPILGILLILVILFLPTFITIDISNFLSSVDLYFQKFEFNASIYYPLRFIGEKITGYNLIHYLGPILALIALCLILYISKLNYSKKQTSSIADSMLLMFCSYLFLATTVHPWYLTIPIFLCVFSTIRFPLVWSWLIFLSYFSYSHTPYFENLVVIGLEYSFLIVFMILEYKRIKLSTSPL